MPPCTLNWYAWLSPQEEASSEDETQESLQTVCRRHVNKAHGLRNHLLWSDEMKINLFSSDGFKHVKRRPGEEYKDKCVMPTVKHGGGKVMVEGCMSAAGVGELYFIEGNMNPNMYCIILLQSMIPSLQKLGSRAVF